MSTEVMTVDQQAIGDALSASAIKAQVQLIHDVMRETMIKDVHYGVIPGTTKPTLLKPGAQKLMLTFRFDPQFQTTERFAGEHLFVKSTCVLYHVTTGRRFGSGEGSCSTKESKYAYRQGKRLCPKCGKEAIIKGKEEYGGGWLCWKKKDGCGAQWPAGAKEIEDQKTDRVPNEDLADQYNTVLKIANKRSLVDAVLNVTGASDVFTQDVEDMQPPDKDNPPIDAASPRGGQTSQEAETANDPVKSGGQKDDLFDQSSAQVEHEVALKECEIPTDKQVAIDALQKAWDDTVKDKRLTSESRPQLYELMKRIEKKIRARK